MDKSFKRVYIVSTVTDENSMKAFSHNQKRLAVALFLAICFMFTSSTAITMPLHMDDCTVKTACENCCIISVPELSGLQYEYSFTACPDDALADMPTPAPLPFDHPPQ